MITGSEFQEIVYGYWAKRFECERDDFVHPGTLVIAEEALDGSGTLHLYHIDRMSVVRTDPSLAKNIGLQSRHSGEALSLDVNALEELVGENHQIEVRSMLLDSFLDAKDFKPQRAGDDLSARELDPEKDNSILMNLYKACSEDDLDAAEIYLDEPDPFICGLFAGEQLVAYASHRYWDEVIADIGVLIHPGYRGQGLAKAVVSELCKWCLKNEVVPMYRVFSDHDHSRRIPPALGFKELVIVETLKLSEKDAA